MNYIENKVWDKAFDTVFRAASDEIKAILDEKNLQKLLLQSFSVYINLEEIRNPKAKPNCHINKRLIMSVKKSMILPNFTIEELEKNLKEIFDECIITDDKDKAANIRRMICFQYKISVCDYMTLSQVDDDIHSLENTTKQATSEINKKLDNIKEIQKKINSKLKMLPQQQIIFIDELDNSRFYCYISMQLTQEIDEDLARDIADHTYSEEEIYTDEQGFTNLNLNFEEPIAQVDLKEYLVYIDQRLSGENIGILRITSHF